MNHQLVPSMTWKYWGVQRTFAKSEETQRDEERTYQSLRVQFEVGGEEGGSWLEAVVQTPATLMKSLILALSTHSLHICSMLCWSQLLGQPQCLG